ncbi:MAG TPA: glycosyltransferase [Prosthecobacter sp.]
MPASVHLVIPCYRESGRLGPFLKELCKVTGALEDVTIRVVEDGSDKEEKERMRELIEPIRQQHAHLLEPLFLPDNLGKGGAVYSGWNLEKEADWLGFVDADGSCSAAEVAKLIGHAREQLTPHSALFASRLGQFNRHVHRQIKRRLMGHIFATLVSTLLGIRVHDSQCGLKLVPRAAYERIAPFLVIRGFAFDVELLANLHDIEVPFLEVPIEWFEVPGGSVRIFRDSWRMARDVWRVRVNRRRGVAR